jgi:hypothetical protein
MKTYHLLIAAALVFTATVCVAGDAGKAPEASDRNAEASQSSPVSTGVSKTQDDDC